MAEVEKGFVWALFRQEATSEEELWSGVGLHPDRSPTTGSPSAQWQGVRVMAHWLPSYLYRSTHPPACVPTSAVHIRKGKGKIKVGVKGGAKALCLALDSPLFFCSSSSLASFFPSPPPSISKETA
ncbi:hypothetical protein Q8A73_000697 [Channa argus]|nr:hypothetical protein Q8A73_000697 [Channa argus]